MKYLWLLFALCLLSVPAFCDPCVDFTIYVNGDFAMSYESLPSADQPEPDVTYCTDYRYYFHQIGGEWVQITEEEYAEEVVLPAWTMGWD